MRQRREHAFFYFTGGLRKTQGSRSVGEQVIRRALLEDQVFLVDSVANGAQFKKALLCFLCRWGHRLLTVVHIQKKFVSVPCGG